MKRSLVCFALILSLFSITGIPSQDDALQTKPVQETADEKIKVRTELMEVRAIVRDRDGRVVENLKKEDFELLENDRQQEISFFSISQIEGERSGSVAVDEAKEDRESELKKAQERLREPPVRTTLLYVDNLHISFSSLNRVKEAIRTFIRERLTEQDMIALATSGQTLGIAQQFTRDRRILNYAIEQIRLGPLSRETRFTPELAVSVLEEYEDALRLATSIEARESNTNCCDILLSLSRNHALKILAEGSISRKSMLLNLKGFAEQMVDLPGKRMIVIFSDGFTLRSYDGLIDDREVRRVIDRAVRSGVVIYTIDSKGLQAPATVDASLGSPNYPASIWPSVALMREYCAKMQEAGEKDPKCYPCGAPPDPRCHFAPDPGLWFYYINSAEREELDGMYSLADETGGKMYHDTNDLGGALDQAFNANRYYYVLSYYLRPREDGVEFRRINVRVRDHPEYTVRTARGFAPPDLTMEAEVDSAKTPQQRLLQAMKAPVPITDLGVSARADFLQTDTDDSQVSLTVYFDGDRFQYLSQDQRNVFELEILYAVYDSSGKQVEGISAHVEGRLSQDRLKQAKTSGYRFSRRLALKPGVYQVRVGVREKGTNRLGTASAWVDVPELAENKLQMSSLILSNPLEIRPVDAEGMDVGELEQIKMVQGVPLFERGDFFDYSFRVYRGTQTLAKPQLEWMPEVFRRGTLIKPGKWMPISVEKGDIDSKGWFDVYGEVGVGEFSSGIYELRVSVKDSGSDKTARRTVVFSVE